MLANLVCQLHPQGFHYAWAIAQGTYCPERLRDWPKLTQPVKWATASPTQFPTTGSLLTWSGHVVLHLEERLMAALSQHGQGCGMAGPMQRDPINTEQPVAHLQGALPKEKGPHQPGRPS